MSVQAFVRVLEIAILVYFSVVNVSYLAFTVVAFVDLISYRWRVWRGELRSVLAETAAKPMSILVPCHDEERTVVATLSSLLALGYPEYEVIVINDGSTDGTLEVLRREFDLVAMPDAVRVQVPSRPIRTVYRSTTHPDLVVVDKERGGKSDALNAGINVSRFPLYCGIDADSVLEADALLHVGRLMELEPDVMAAGGIVRVLNGSVIEHGRVAQVRAPRGFLPLIQSIEYVRAFLTGRAAMASLNALMILSGAFAVFRKERVIAAGGYDVSTVCEDLELVVRLHRRADEDDRPGRVVFLPEPICWTQVPSDLGSLMRQRDRWHRGLLETLWMHRRMMFNASYGSRGLIGLPYYLVIEALAPLVETLGYLLLIVLAIAGLLQPWFAIAFLILAVLYGVILSVGALIVDDLLFRRYERLSDILRLIIAGAVEHLGIRQLLTLRRALSFVTVFGRGSRGSWGRIEREPMGGSEPAAGRS